MKTITESLSGALCVLRLDAPPVNAITRGMLEELRAAVRRANDDPRVRAVVLAGRPGHFSAGADVALFRGIAGADDARRLARDFQEAFRAVEDSAKPVAAVVGGAVMGGALELAMACHVRVAERGATFRMPEVTLGINPGAGGTGRLPRLVGAEAALRMMLTGEPLDAAAALERGLVDAVCDDGDPLACAAARLEGAAPRRTRDLREQIADAAANETAWARARERLAAARPELPAPSLILDAVRTGIEASFDDGLRREREAFARCMETPAVRNKLHVFFAARETARVPGDAAAPAAPVRRVAVVGMGSMGTGIAQAVLAAGLPVTVLDEHPAALRGGRERIRESLEKRVRRGRLAPDRLAATMGRLATTTEASALAGADLVIEAVFEDPDAKRAVLRAAEAACPEALLATNTSTLSLDALAEGLRRPERLVGLHFFNPAHRMPLLEVIRRDATSPEAVATALGFARALRKTPVLVRNREGFLVNRLFIPYVKEAFWLLQDGAEAEAVDRAMVDFGFPMGPLAVIDMAGIDILVDTDAVMARAFPHHGPTPPVATALAAAGRAGQKRGAGVYRYAPGDRTPRPCPEAGAIIARARAGRPQTAFDADAIARRLVLRMVAEGFRLLEEGLVQRESDVDVALVLGIGFPDFRGGVLRHARDLGLPVVLRELEALAARWGERFAPCTLLREMKGAA